jgi:hypothetical protein
VWSYRGGMDEFEFVYRPNSESCKTPLFSGSNMDPLHLEASAAAIDAET